MQAAHPGLSAGGFGVSRTRGRMLVLTVLFLLGAALVAVIDTSAGPAAPRWPTDPDVFAVEGWREVAPATTEVAPSGATFVNRFYRGPGGTAVNVSLATSTEAKRVHRAGADVPFLGSGYSVEPAPTSLVEPASGRDVLVARRESELGVLVYGFGERRGLLGNGLPGWAAIALDAIRGQPNDYYLIRLYTTVERLDRSATDPVVELADALMPRIARWYAAQP